MREAVIPAEMGFTSFHGIRRTQRGIGLWIVALVVPAVSTMVFVLTILASPLFWDELSDRQDPYRLLYVAAIYVWMYGASVAKLVHAVAVTMIIGWPLRPNRRIKLWLATAVVVSALVSAACVGIDFDVMPRSARGAQLATWAVGTGFYVLSLYLCWICLTVGLEQGRWRRLRRLMGAALLAPTLLALGVALRLIVALTDPSPTVPFGLVYIIEEPQWWLALRSVSLSWSRYGHTSCLILMIVALWLYVHKLNSALRTRSLIHGKNGHAAAR